MYRDRSMKISMGWNDDLVKRVNGISFILLFSNFEGSEVES